MTSSDHADDVARDDHGIGARALVLGAAGAAIGAVPFPLVPSRVQRALRGALAHDIAHRHGLALTAGARARLGEPSASGEGLSFGAEAVRYVARRLVRRWTLVGALVGPAREGAEVIALGRLFERYLTIHRETGAFSGSPRIDEAEAVAVRRAIDAAVTHAWLPSEAPPTTPRTTLEVEDLRGPVERTLDRVILAVATVPDALSSRLDHAFDRALEGARAAEAHG